jgi:hypothetical protein
VREQRSARSGSSRETRAIATARGHWLLAAVGLGALIVTMLFLALEPSPARAWVLGLPSAGQVVGGLLGGLGHVIGGTVGKLAVTAFDAIIHVLFAPIAHFINTQLIGWLVAVPDYAPPGSHVAATERTVLAMAGAGLGAIATISIARFWTAGLAGSGGSALEGLARTVGAALLLPVWPWLFHSSVALANAASTGLLGSGSVTKASANLLAVGVGAGIGLGFLGVGLFVAIVMAVVASVLFLVLLMMKVVLAISTVLVFIEMPIAIVLSPVMSWIPRVLARAFLVCLAVPLVWSICFAASGALLNDGLFLKGSSGFFDALLEPLAAIALLWLMLLLPTRLAQMAMLGAGAMSGGFVSRAVSYAAGSQLRDVTRQHLPGLAGGHGGGGEQRGRETDSRLGVRLRAESVLAASKAAGVGGATAAAGAAAARVASSGKTGGSNGGTNGHAEHHVGWLGRLRGTGNPCAYSPPPLAGREVAVVASGGLQRPSWRQEHFDSEILEASLREQHQPVSAEQARQARDALPPATQGAVGALIADQGPRVRQHLAYQALGEWTPREREAIRTLAAASPDVRAQAFTDSTEAMAGFGESAEPIGARVSGSSLDTPTTPAARAATSGEMGTARTIRAGDPKSGDQAAPQCPTPSTGPGQAGDRGTPVRSPQDQPRQGDGEGS